MKSLILISSFLLIHGIAKGQIDSIYRMHAENISNRMKDSLILSEIQFNAIYQATYFIGKQKESIWLQYASSDSLRIYLQRIENKRDSLYMQSLNDIGKYQQYLEKKNSFEQGCRLFLFFEQ